MNKEYTKYDWIEFINSQSIEELIKKSYLTKVELAYKNSVPVIIDIDHLAMLFGLKVGILSSIIYSTDSFYRSFEIPKRKGGNRKIVAPFKSLLECQRWINNEILNKVQLHNSAFAYRKNLNIVKNAQMHVGNKFMLKLDLINFFDNIRIGQIRKVFKKLGYDRDMSFFLSRICSLNTTLPQGGATSPTLSNIILKNLDDSLEEICCNNKIVYTRYADDLVFSSEYRFEHVIDKIEEIIEMNSFQVNIKKSKLYIENSNKIVTGIAVHSECVRLPKKTRRKIRQEVHFIEKNGIFYEIEQKFDFFIVERILGKLYFWKQVEPQNQYVLSKIQSLKKLRIQLLKT